MARGLLTLSTVVLGVAGLAYILVPGLALGIVGVESTPTTDFLLRTEGVALIFGALIVWLLRDRPVRDQRGGLLALAGYYVISSLVDLVAFGQGIVGPASVPSAIVRVAIGLVCVAVAWTEGSRRRGEERAARTADRRR